MMTNREARWDKISRVLQDPRAQNSQDLTLVMNSPEGGFHILGLPFVEGFPSYEESKINRKERVFDAIEREHGADMLHRQFGLSVGYVLNKKLGELNYYQQADMLWFMINFVDLVIDSDKPAVSHDEDLSKIRSIEHFEKEGVVYIDMGFKHISEVETFH